VPDSPASSVDREVDVAVIGAGIAGLVAATRLREAGLTCTLLERHNRVGGRLFTHRSSKGSFDLGATWFWPGESRVAALIRELNIATHAHHLAGDAMFQARDRVQRIDGNPIDVVSGRFSDGAASLAERLAAGLGDTIMLQTAVHQIDHADREVRVSHANGSITAGHVVVALAPSISVHTIRFFPSLPADLVALAASTPVWMGNVTKVVAVYREAFWRKTGLSGAAISHVGPLREIHDISGVNFDPAALFGFVPLEPDAPPPTTDEVIGQLVEIFGPEAAHPVEVLIKDWRIDAQDGSVAATTHSPMGTYGHRLYQEPCGQGRIHWASTETAPVTPGHIEGAIAAAERAVEAITRHRALADQQTVRHGDQ
jgi:monoamine oxidase